jgi:hypothetical protein
VEGVRKTTKDIRIACVTVKIRTEDLPTKVVERYHKTILLGENRYNASRE